MGDVFETPGTGEQTFREITPPMPSIVVRILVRKGDGVKKAWAFKKAMDMVLTGRKIRARRRSRWG